MSDYTIDSRLPRAQKIYLMVVEKLAANGEQACGNFGIAIPKPTLSHHFKVLREAGLIQIRLEGTQRINSLRRQDLDTHFPGLLDAVLQASKPLEGLGTRN